MEVKPHEVNDVLLLAIKPVIARFTGPRKNDAMPVRLYESGMLNSIGTPYQSVDQALDHTSGPVIVISDPR